MTNAKSTKRALITSALAVLMCVAMLIGTTFAWFTDTASTGVNRIQAGNLDIEVEYTLDGENWHPLDEATDLFQKGLWEPGHTEVAAFRFKNAGSLALKYRVSMNIVAENAGVNKAGQEYRLSDFLNVATLSQEANYTGDICIALAFSGRNNSLDYHVADFKDVSVLDDDLSLLAGEVGNYLIMKVYMPENVGNEANAIDAEKTASINFGINVLATQLDHENDSFGKDYDKDAKYPVSSSEELSESLRALRAGQTLPIAPGLYELPADDHAEGVTLSGSGRGKTVLKPEEKNYKPTDATFKDMTIDGTATSDVDNNGVIFLRGNNSVLDNVEVIGGGMNTYGHSVRAGANTTIRNSYIHGAFRAIQAYDVSGTLLIENSVLAPQCYTLNIDAGTGKLVVNNSTLKGWTSYTSTIESATFTDCIFEKNTESGSYGYNYLCPHADTVLKKCAFNGDFQIGAGSPGFTLTIDNCTLNGVKVTAENVKNMLDIDDVLKGCTVIVNGVTVTF